MIVLKSLSKSLPLREGTFLLEGEGGWAGASEGGQTCFIINRGRVTVFLARKKLLHVASILYIPAKLPVKINLNYLQLSKNIYMKKLSSLN